MSQALQTANLPPSAAEFLKGKITQPQSVEEVKDEEQQPSKEPLQVKEKPTVSVLPKRRERSKQEVVTDPIPESLMSLTVRVPSRIPAALIQATAARKIKRQKPYTQQDIVTQAIDEWLKKEGLAEGSS